MFKPVILASAAAALALSTPALAAPTYRVTVIPNAAGFSTNYTSLNNLGEVAGQVTSPTLMAVMWNETKGHTFMGSIDGLPCAVNDLNDRAEATGACGDFVEWGGKRAFKWSPQNGMTEIPEEADSTGWALNNKGVVVGTSRFKVFSVKPLIWHDEKVSLLQRLHIDYGRPTDINENGDVVGWGRKKAADNSFTWVRTGRSYITLPWLKETVIPDQFQEARAINNSKVVVGREAFPDFTSHAFKWSVAEGIIDLGMLPGDFNAIARDINNHGDIIGQSWETPAQGEYEGRAFFIGRGGKMHNLADLVDPNDPYIDQVRAFLRGIKINDRGQILAVTRFDRYNQFFIRLDPIGH